MGEDLWLSTWRRLSWMDGLSHAGDQEAIGEVG